MRPIVVAAAIVRKDDLFLISQRLHNATREAGKWEFAGGKVEFLESPESCAKREIKEELNIDITVGDPYCVTSPTFETDGEEKHFIIIFYLAQYTSGTLQNLECQDSKWVAMSELKQYEFSVGTKPVIEKLLADKKMR